MSRLLKAYQTFLYKYPILTQSIQVGTLWLTADIISQTIIEKQNFRDMNLIRNAQFFAIGFFGSGPIGRVWYGLLNQYIGKEGNVVALKKMALDQFVYTPFFTGVLLVLVSFLQMKSWEDNINDLKKNYPDVMINNYKVWPLVQFINFYFVPLNYQVLVAQVVALFWNTYLSWKTNYGVYDKKEK